MLSPAPELAGPGCLLWQTTAKAGGWKQQGGWLWLRRGGFCEYICAILCTIMQPPIQGNKKAISKGEIAMKKGDYVYTPRFCTVRLEKVFRSEENARKAGYIETTHYQDPKYGILGKSIGLNRMVFAGYRK